MCDTIQNCCRICLGVNSDHIVVLGDPTLSLQMKSCLSISVSSNDHLPKSICVPCASQLHQFYNFQLSARYTQDWFESCVPEKLKKTNDSKMVLQPLPDSEYNSDSLLEFLNNTENIEEYLNNLGKEDIPSIVNMFEKNEHTNDGRVITKVTKTSPKKREKLKTNKMDMEIDVLNSDIGVVKGVKLKSSDSKNKTNNTKVEINFSTCYGCKLKFDGIQKLSQHMSTCDNALRTCIQCDIMFDSKQKLQRHMMSHNTTLPATCNCGAKFLNKEQWIEHIRTCQHNTPSTAGYVHRCMKCGDVFKQRYELYRHAREHVMKADERFCDICGHIFIGDDELANHRQTEHEKSENNLYRCKVCSLTSSDRKEIYVHVQKHIKKPMQSHLCETCGQRFVSKTCLLRHSFRHGSKNVCRICNAAIPNQKSFEVHIRSHDEMVMCERCGETVNSFKLSEHDCV